VTTKLDYVIVGYATNHDQNDKTFQLLAYSEGVPSQDISTYQQVIQLTPFPHEDEHESQAIGMAQYDENTALLARTHYQQGNLEFPVYQYIMIPYEVLSGIGARIAPLQNLINTSIPIYQAHHIAVLPLILPPITTGNLNTRVKQIETLITDLLSNRFELALTLLGAMLHERHLLIRNFPQSLPERTALIQGLRMLLPSAIAMRINFSTNVTDLPADIPHVMFADDFDDVSQWVIDWERPEIIPAVLEHPYIGLLRQLWHNDVSDFVADIKPMDILSLSFIKQADLSKNLTDLTARFTLDLQVRHGDTVATDAMVTALEGESAPQGRLRYQYIEKLLQNALNNRDTVAGKLVAEELNRDDNLDAALSRVFDDMLETQPDTVYVFIRNRLNNLGIDDRWIVRLQQAAKNSLDVAIEDGDVQTLVGWLELIAREPVNYQLEDILRDGILKAQPRARDNGELGIRLILITTRRVPDILDQLYNDDALMNALPRDVGQALRETTTDSLENLIDDVPEYFLLALFHATQTDHSDIVNNTIMQYLWTLYRAEEPVNLPMIYRPASLVRLLGTQSSTLLTEGAISFLLEKIIDRGDNQLFVEVATHLANREMLFPRLSQILQKDERSFEQVQAYMNWVADIDNVAPQNIADTYIVLLDYWNWSADTQSMVEAFARLLGQHPSLDVSSRHLWKLFETCTALGVDSATRVAINQLLQQLQQEDDVEKIVQGISRIYQTVGSNKSGIATIDGWWRQFTSTCSLVQLQRIDRELDAQRILEAPRQILRSAIAMRRLMGNRDLTEFADAIQTAYSILESITDAFDKSTLTDIDATTIRNELNNMGDDLSPDERFVLAKNLRELAQHITQMADKRSKPSLMRSDEAIDRQLMQGDANPQGSIDVMKWMAGYLDGAHDNDE